MSRFNQYEIDISRDIMARASKMRRDKRISLAAVGAHLGLTASAVGYMELGRSPLTVGRLVKLAAFLQTSPEHLLQAATLPETKEQRIQHTLKLLSEYGLPPHLAQQVRQAQKLAAQL